MSSDSYDDPAIEEKWCLERRAEVIQYLEGQNLQHGEVGEWPAWHVAPYVSIWAIESLLYPGSVGWWAICGDLPTDYISASGLNHPRKAMATFANLWSEVASAMERNEPHPTIQMGTPETWPQLAPLLKSRSGLLREWSSDDSLWEE